jgi:hypothetical protein
MRVLTKQDEAIRQSSKTLFSHLWKQHNLTDTQVAIKMLPKHRREELRRHGGARKVAQDSPRKSVASWRLGEKTLSSTSAFELGEALHSLNVPYYSGPRMLYNFGYGADLARMLVIMDP